MGFAIFQALILVPCCLSLGYLGLLFVLLLVVLHGCHALGSNGIVFQGRLLGSGGVLLGSDFLGSLII